MTILKKITAAVILSAMLAVSFACAEADDKEQTIETKPAETEYEEETEEPVKSSIPADLKFDGEKVTVLARSATTIFDCAEEFFVEESNGEPINDAVLKRNMDVETQLNINLNVDVINDTGYSVLQSMLQKSFAAGDHAYDIIASYAYYGVTFRQYGVFYNLTELPYLDLDNEWWNRSFVDEVTFNDKLYFISGDLSLSSIECTHAIFFNKVLMENYYGNADLYDEVRNGTWTVERFGQLSSGCHEDINGDGKMDEGDIYGVGMSGVSIPTDAFLDAFDLKLTEKDGDGIPQFVYNNERSVDAYGKLYSLCHENEGTLFGSTTLETYNMFQTNFGSGNALFLIDIFRATETLRSMEDDYGVLPIFKYDEAQEGYYTNAADVYSILSVFAGTPNPEIAGATFELMAQKSHELVIPAYFELSLKQKYSRSNEDAQMYDIVLGGCRYNFGFVYSADLGSPIHMWRALIGSKSTDFVSTWQKSEKAFNRSLTKLIESLQKDEA